MVLSHALQDGFEGFRRSLTLSHPRPLRIYVTFSCVNIHTQFISVAAAECPRSAGSSTFASPRSRQSLSVSQQNLTYAVRARLSHNEASLHNVKNFK